MANTVNDVMNVIASPDYGIKNIAGTTQEILAVLNGTHNSQNNIHNIVDDVKNLLQKLVTATEKKSVEIGDKSAKINQKHISDILDETKGIRKAIDNLTKAFEKQRKEPMPTVAKLSDKASEKVAEAMLKDMEKQNKDGGLSGFIDSFKSLKNISLKDIFLGKQKLKQLTKIFNNAKENLKDIDEKNLNNIIKLINAAPEMVKALSRMNWRLNRIIKNNVIEKLNDIFVGKKSLLTLSQKLQKNEDAFEKANKITKYISELAVSINKTLKKLFFASTLAKPTLNGIKNIETILNKLTTISQKLTKNEKTIKSGAKAAKQLTVLTGNLLASSIFLTIAAITGAPALLGATLLDKTIDKIIPTVKKLSKNKKHLNEAVKSALTLTAFTGLMAVSSAFLATVAVTGIPALLGSVLMLGIVKINTFAFKMLGKAKKNIIIGSLAMLIMSGSLILFGIGLKKIVDATKGVNFKQVGVIASLTLLLGGSVALLGFLPVAISIGIGSVALGVMGLALLPFAKTLATISNVTSRMKKEDVKVIGNAITTIGITVAKMSLLAIPVTLGSSVIGMMSLSLQSFTKSLKKINDLGSIPNKQIYQVLNAIKTIGNFFKENPLRIKTIRQARRYKRMLRPFGKTIKHLAKLKEIGVLPMKLVHQTLDAMRTIANYYVENPIKRKTIRQARKYKRMLRPFGKTINYLAKLKEMGVLPMKLIHQTLDTMKTIANYYIENPIKKKAIKQARRYKRMLRPFGKTIKYLSELKEMGIIPMKLVYGTLDTMGIIANYYAKNPIKKKAIKQAKRYKRMLKPFGKTIKYLSELKEMGIIPMKLVYGTLDAMNIIGEYYTKNPIKKRVIKQARRYKRLLKQFGNSIEHFIKLKDLQGGVPVKDIQSTLMASQMISNFYNNIYFTTDIDLKSEYVEQITNKFTELAKKIKQNTANFSTSDYVNVLLSIKSMRAILYFLRKNTLGYFSRIRANKNITLLNRMTYTMLNLSKIDPTNISSVGESLSITLDSVKSIDMDRIEAVTNMFNAFSKINKSENIINKFADNVKDFTEACKNLVDAMGYNTTAINNMDISSGGNNLFSNIKEKTTDFVGVGTNNDTNTQTNGIRITNVDEIAKTIAERINGALSLDMPDTQVQLLINGMGGNEWVISRY